MKPISVYAMNVSVLVIIFAMINQLNKKSHQRLAVVKGIPLDFIKKMP